MKSLLIIGSLDSVHIFNYIKNVIEENLDKYDVTVFNQVAPLSCVKESYLEYYKKIGIKIIGGTKVCHGRIKYVLNTYKTLKTLGHFDIVHVHYVSHYLSPVLYALNRNYKKIILTYWGSDILRSSSVSRLLTLPLVRCSDKITFTADVTNDYFMSFKRHKGMMEKCEVFDFGDLFLDDIDRQMLQPIEASKQRFGLDPKSITIVVGYCGRREMQQQKAIESLKTLPKSYIDRVELVLPVIGMDKLGVESLCKTLGGFKNKVINDFLGPEDVAKLRIGGDVFIHPQTTDALSNSVIEHIYGGGILLNASWLRYPSLDRKNVYYEQFDTFEKLPEKLIEIIDNIDNLKQKNKGNHSKIFELASWKFLKGKWLRLYE